MLYRSALPAPGDSRPTAVDHWPAWTVVDLRSPREFATRTHPLKSDGIVVHQISLLSDAEVAAPNQGARLADIYHGILTNSGERLVEVLQVAATAPGPVLLHCAAGKDRTGVAIALLLRTAGVEPDDIVADYLSTNEHMGAVLARVTRFAPELGRTHPNDRDLRGAVPEAQSPRPSRESWPSGTPTLAACMRGCSRTVPPTRRSGSGPSDLPSDHRWRANQPVVLPDHSVYDPDPHILLDDARIGVGDNAVDRFATHRDVAGPVAAELAADGFVDALEIGRDGFGAIDRQTLDHTTTSVPPDE